MVTSLPAGSKAKPLVDHIYERDEKKLWSKRERGGENSRTRGWAMPQKGRRSKNASICSIDRNKYTETYSTWFGVGQLLGHAHCIAIYMIM